MARALRVAQKEAWFQVGVLFHAEMSDRRFTHAHASQAGYAKRSAKYTIRKLRRFGHTNPLEFSGRTRRMVRTANITSTGNGAAVRYPGARVFNFRNPKSQVNAVVEFTTVTQAEADVLARKFDQVLDAKLNADQGNNHYDPLHQSQY